MEHRDRLRIALLSAAAAAMLLVFMAALYRLQTAEQQKTVSSQEQGYTYTTTITAARGEILDRNGVVLVSNRVSYYATLNSYVLFHSDNLNETLLSLIETCRRNGIDHTDTLRVSSSQPWTYTEDSDYYFRSFMIYRDLDPDMKAANLMRHLRRDYGIPDDWTDEQARTVIGLRYELDLRYAVNIDSYVLADDLSADELAVLRECSVPGLSIETTTQRVYNTPYAAHVLGFVGAMFREDYEQLRDEGYSMNASIGKDGAEKAFESYLRGTDGTRTTTITSGGQILDEYISVEPQAGSNVYLSIDIGLQQVAEETLADTISELRAAGEAQAEDAKGEGEDAEGGAIVVMDVRTGQVLASASYPTYNLSTYNRDYNELLQTDYSPLYNRVLQAPYPPGSTYKPVVGLAAITAGIINKNYEINDLGKYTYYDTFQPTCLAYSRSGVPHGVLNLMQAISVSCNYYFYEIGRLTGIETIDAMAGQLGLGEATGVELYEETGHRANPETKRELYDLDWYGADTLTAAIGQSDNAFTPMQLVCYTSALANRGTRYRATYLNRVVSSDYNGVVYTAVPEIAGVAEASDEAWDAIAEGMEMAVQQGTAKALADYSYPVAAKTGTADHGSTGSANAAFICYAPADDPQIAIVIYVEKGAAGSALASAAEPLLTYYFSRTDAVELVSPELSAD